MRSSSIESHNKIKTKVHLALTSGAFGKCFSAHYDYNGDAYLREHIRDINIEVPPLSPNAAPSGLLEWWQVSLEIYVFQLDEEGATDECTGGGQ